MTITFKKIEQKWQLEWERKKAFEVKEARGKKKFYVLEMYPYPSAGGLHMGHALNYTIGDIQARFRRMQGFNVLYPMGYDSFGLPAENAAIKAGEHPKKYTNKAIANFMKQQSYLGLSYDWQRKIQSHDTDYYKWNQYFFLKFLEKGLAYRKKAAVNWCKKCDSVLANEQVHNGKCWRHTDTEVETKQLEQWFLKITDYANELLNNVDKLDWPERIKIMQKNWIGKSHGTEIEFEVANKNKVVLVDAVHCLVDAEGKVNQELRTYLDVLGNKKIVLTNAPKENHKVFFKNIDYEIFTLENKPNKKNPDYYEKVLKKFNLGANDVIYFEHDKESAESAKSVGINTLFYQNKVGEVKEFVNNALNQKWSIFTTRPDTIFGVTFMVVSAQHPRLFELVTKEQKSKVEKFFKKVKSIRQEEVEQLDKEGVFTGSYAINPLTNEKIPVWVGNFVLADYGSGMVMAVPAHDQRDFEFAKKYNLKIKEVIKGGNSNINEKAYVGEGVLVNSGKFNSIDSRKAIEEITKHLQSKKLGEKQIQYKLKDWLISRQRYWGTPIPVVYCDECGIVPVSESQLPVKLPDKVKFGKGNPLATNKQFVNAKCPKCKGKAQRETDTMDTFFDSSWYYLRYCDSRNKKQPFDKKKVEYWMPVNQYIGGAEHACMHLIYARFFTKVLRDLKIIGKIDEPFIKLFNQGMLHGSDGFVMSKSRGNVINPLDIIKKYSADILRIYLISVAAPDSDYAWSDKGIEGVSKFVNKIINYFNNIKFGKSSARIESKLHKAIKEITDDIDNFRYNLAVIKLRQLFEVIESEKYLSKGDAGNFLKLLSLFCPYIAEEFWHKIGNKTLISLENWPKADEKKIDDKLEHVDNLVDKVIGDINNIVKLIKEKQNKVAEKCYLYVLPSEFVNYNNNLEKIKKRTNIQVQVFAVNDKNKYDPNEKANKAKPGKPGIYVE